MSPATNTRRSASAPYFHKLSPVKNLPVETGTQLKTARQRADASRAAHIATALAKRSSLTRQNITIQVTGPLVRLTGQVGSYYEKQLATAAVQSVDSVEQLENDLKVDRGLKCHNNIRSAFNQAEATMHNKARHD